MKKLNLILGIICIIIGLITFTGSAIGAIILILIGAWNIYLYIKNKKAVAAKTETQETNQEVQPELISDELTETDANNDTYLVAGFDYHQDALKSLLNEVNPDYEMPKKQFLEEVDDRAYQFFTEYYPVRLEREPNNEYDPNAIAVYVEDMMIGYVAKKDQKHIDLDKAYEAEVFGGKYKEINFDDYEEDVIKGETPVKAVIYEK